MIVTSKNHRFNIRINSRYGHYPGKILIWTISYIN